MTQAFSLLELSPKQVAMMLREESIILIDVREPGEFNSEHIEGAQSFPLSSFDPAALPQDAARTVVLQCGVGKRSAMAVQRCLAAGIPVHTHLTGGLMAWKAAGLPTVSDQTRGPSLLDRILGRGSK
jgi:rhodanese-related sulfurtransferase